MLVFKSNEHFLEMTKNRKITYSFESRRGTKRVTT